MAFLRLGSKLETFSREGQTLFCSTGLPSDVSIHVGEMTFHLHKFPLISRSGLMEKLIEGYSSEEGAGCVLKLNEVPGGGKTFEIISKFCYGVKIELTALNVVSLRCAAEHLDMNENFGVGNLIGQTEAFLGEVFCNWTDTIKALQTCEEVLPYAEELHIVSRSIDSLAVKATSDSSIFSWPLSAQNEDPALNGRSPAMKRQVTADDWWFEDVSLLSLPIFKRVILALETRHMKPENIAAAIMYYAKKHIPTVNRQSNLDDTDQANASTNVSSPSEAEQKARLEEIVGLLPNKKGVSSTKFLLRLLRTAMVLRASDLCKENLEKRVGSQLDNASLVDLLIPNMGYSETLYDIDCVQRMIDHFMSSEQASMTSTPGIVDDVMLMNGSESLASLTMVASLLDAYLAEVAPDASLKLAKFEMLAASIPDYGRLVDDGIYNAIDVYLKAHSWITDTEREHICRLMNCQKLSLEASTHAAQNERLPLRVIVQVVFFEQLRLRTSISGWFFDSENIENSQYQSAIGLPKLGGGRQRDSNVGADDVRGRVSELEKECSNMKQEIQKLAKTRKSWTNFAKVLLFKRKSESN